jgi:hypothetical protein
MKDFYDIWLLSRQHDFEMDELLSACCNTFDQRGTPCSLDNPLFGDEMKRSDAKQSQWSAFRRKNKHTTCPESFASLLDELLVFLHPLAFAIGRGETPVGHWSPSNGWQSD